MICKSNVNKFSPSAEVFLLSGETQWFCSYFMAFFPRPLFFWNHSTRSICRVGGGGGGVALRMLYPSLSLSLKFFFFKCGCDDLLNVLSFLIATRCVQAGFLSYTATYEGADFTRGSFFCLFVFSFFFS